MGSYPESEKSTEREGTPEANGVPILGWIPAAWNLFVRFGLISSILAVGISTLGGIIGIPIMFFLHDMVYGNPQNPGAWVFLYLYVPALIITTAVVLIGILSFFSSLAFLFLKFREKSRYN